MIESKEVNYIFCFAANDNASVSNRDFLLSIRFKVLGIPFRDPPNPFWGVERSHNGIQKLLLGASDSCPKFRDYRFGPERPEKRIAKFDTETRRTGEVCADPRRDFVGERKVRQIRGKANGSAFIRENPRLIT